jgi:hypothetical protein
VNIPTFTIGAGNGLGGKKKTPLVVNPQVPAAVAFEHVWACTFGTMHMKNVAKAISTKLVGALYFITFLLAVISYFITFLLAVISLLLRRHRRMNPVGPGDDL